MKNSCMKVKFHVNALHSFNVMLLTIFKNEKLTKSNDTKSMMPRGMVLVHCSSMRSICLWIVKSVAFDSFELCSGQNSRMNKGQYLKKMKLWIMVLVHCASPQEDLSTYEVAYWCLAEFLSYAPDGRTSRFLYASFGGIKTYLWFLD